MRWSTRAVATIAGRPGGGGRDVVCTAAAGSMLGMPAAAAACGARCSLGVGALGETGRRDTSSPQLVFIEITHRASEHCVLVKPPTPRTLPLTRVFAYLYLDRRLLTPCSEKTLPRRLSVCFNTQCNRWLV